MNSVENTLSKTLSSDDVNFWTNSKVTLTWISAVEKEYKTFVENPVQEIRKTAMFLNSFIVTLKKTLLSY